MSAYACRECGLLCEGRRLTWTWQAPPPPTWQSIVLPRGWVFDEHMRVLCPTCCKAHIKSKERARRKVHDETPRTVRVDGDPGPLFKAKP
jgi:hypothetical protein